MSRIIGVVSAKGGVGKTVVTINLAAALMKFNKNVVIVDGDLKLSGLGLQLGMYHFPITLNDVLNKKINILEALYIHSSGLRIIPASLRLENTNVSRLKEIFENSFSEFDIVLIDAPPGLERNSLSVLKACKEILFVTLPEIPSVAEVMKTMEIAKNFDAKFLGIIVNRYKKRNKQQITPREIEAACGLPIIGLIPEDNTIGKSVFQGIPAVFLNNFSPSSISFMKIAAKICNENYYRPPKLSVLKRFLRRIKK
jgi:cell division ATPase MinD